ncbi:TetR/AcrR family transcriptional regulator [Streptomyces sp. NPDC057199]|uniref:TetR/AcrR family transcriptional regulator n=1 Tax=Streptomyces sp. NPDC057199 TaxID=3346047 RepID=UPI00362DC3A9
MPVEIDVDQRLAAIADATLEIVAAQGIDGVTIRAVAKRIGGSTTLVTNYLPNREALLRNAVEHAIRSWDKDLRAAIEGVIAEERLFAAVHWASSTVGNDQVLRKLFMELLGRGEPGSGTIHVIRQDTRRIQESLREAADEARAPDSAFTADIVTLVLRGFYLCSLEDPERWTSERMTPLVERLLRLLVPGP